LLFTQLLAITGKALTGLLAMLAGGVGTALNRALVSEALFALQKELLSFTTALTAFWIKITGHLAYSP
jgi:hypothetical protein